jgi:NADH:ubiquinone oxidoreductase subunit 2 (subunit N)
MYYQDNKLKFYIIVCLLIISSVIVGVIEYLLRNEEIFVGIINWIGVIFNIGEYLPIGFDYFYLVKNKISEKYTLLGAYVGIINTILWLIWSIIRTFTNIEDQQNNGKNNEKKYHSFVANIFGLLLCLSQLALYYIYKKDDEKDNDIERPLDEKGTDNSSDNRNNLITFNESENLEEKKIEDEFI